jgi:hypothetical protein
MEAARRDRAAALNAVREQQEFVRRLTETISWCRDLGSLSHPKTSLRTCKRELQDLESQHTQVFRVALERAHRLRGAGKRDLAPVIDLCGGRLLAYFPDDNLACGVAEAESLGFFDVDNIPPHDTWVWLTPNVRSFTYEDGAKGEMNMNYLVAWVPPEFIPLASGGVKVNPEECIVWLDALADEFTQSLRDLGLLS